MIALRTCLHQAFFAPFLLVLPKAGIRPHPENRRKDRRRPLAQAAQSTFSRFSQQALKPIALAVAAVAVSATPALATVYNFTSTDIPGFGPSPTTTSFSLDTATATVIPNGSQFSNVDLIYDGTDMPNSSIFALFGTNLANSLFFFVDTDARPFFTGAGATTIFNTGTFAIGDGFTDGEGTLSISTTPSAAVPEAATWSMMLIGFGAMGISLRRRGRRPATQVEPAPAHAG